MFGIFHPQDGSALEEKQEGERDCGICDYSKELGDSFEIRDVIYTNIMVVA